MTLDDDQIVRQAYQIGEDTDLPTTTHVKGGPR
jgi:hypothetical protein